MTVEGPVGGAGGVPAVGSGICVVQVTAPSRSEADRLGRLAVSRRLAACAQVSGPVTSTYWWEGEVRSATEWVCTMKTTAAAAPELVAMVEAEHPYEVPEALVLPVGGGLTAYLAWVGAEVDR